MLLRGFNRRKALGLAWPQFGGPTGFFLANLAILAFSQMSGDQFLSWGWRVPFWLSIVMVGIGLWIRLGILETPIFQQVIAEERVARAPVNRLGGPRETNPKGAGHVTGVPLPWVEKGT